MPNLTFVKALKITLLRKYFVYVKLKEFNTFDKVFKTICRTMYPFVKRILDFFAALIIFSLVSPLFVLVYLILLISFKGNPMFFQERPGKNERIFKIMKFKSMNDKKDTEGKLLPDKERLTPVGSFIRKVSLDEIPQLINVLKGDMSLVGPRPLRVRYLPYYTKQESKRHTVRPGITGLAQVSGRNNLSWDDRLALDVEYVENRSFWLDMKILFKTLLKVIRPSKAEINFDETMIDSLDEYRSLKKT